MGRHWALLPAHISSFSGFSFCTPHSPHPCTTTALPKAGPACPLVVVVCTIHTRTGTNLHTVPGMHTQTPHVHTYIHIYMCLYMYAYVHAHWYTDIHMHTYGSRNTGIHTSTRACTCIYTQANTHTEVSLCL